MTGMFLLLKVIERFHLYPLQFLLVLHVIWFLVFVHSKLRTFDIITFLMS